MRKSILALFPLVCVAFTACATNPFAGMTSAQAIAIAQPVVTGALEVVLAKNPSYKPLAQEVGSDLMKANYGDLTVIGINQVVAQIGAKYNLTPEVVGIIAGSLDAGVGAYLAAVAEKSLSNDPNAVLVLQALGQSIATAGSS